MASLDPNASVHLSPFLDDSALADVMHRLGVMPDTIAELESAWWFWGLEYSPDDLASTLMGLLPMETLAEAEHRRSCGRMGLCAPKKIGRLRTR